MSSGQLPTHSGDDRQKNHGLFIGGDPHVISQPPTAPSSSLRKAVPHPASSSRQRIPGRGTSGRMPSATTVVPRRDDATRLITIVAIGVAVMGIIGLALLMSSSPVKVASPPPPQTKVIPLNVAPQPADITPIEVVPLSRPAPKPAPPTTKNESVPNGSFEQIIDNQPVSWFTDSFNGQSEFQLTSDGRRGGHAVQITSQSGGDSSWWVSIPVKPHATYLLKGWARCENLQGARGAQFNLHPTEIRSDAINGTKPWTQLIFSFETGDQTQVRINCLYGGWGTSTGTAWFDDLELIELFSGK